MISVRVRRRIGGSLRCVLSGDGQRLGQHAFDQLTTLAPGAHHQPVAAGGQAALRGAFFLSTLLYRLLDRLLLLVLPKRPQ